MNGYTELLTKAFGEEISHVCFGPSGWEPYIEDDEESILDNDARKHGLVNHTQYKIDDPGVVEFLKSISFYTGYGSPNVPAVYAYTKNHIIFVVEYGGSTTLSTIRRNPSDGLVRRFGVS